MSRAGLGSAALRAQNLARLGLAAGSSQLGVALELAQLAQHATAGLFISSLQAAHGSATLLPPPLPPSLFLGPRRCSFSSGRAAAAAYYSVRRIFTGCSCPSSCAYCSSKQCSAKGRCNSKSKSKGSSPVKPPSTSCRKKSSDNTSFVTELRDHFQEFVHASMDEHKTCFTKTVKRMFAISKVVVDRTAEAKEAGTESVLPLQTKVSR